MTIAPNMYAIDTATPHRHIMTTLDYCASPTVDFGFDTWTKEKEPYFQSMDQALAPRRCVVTDVRGYQDRFQLGRDGFEYAQVENAGHDVYEDAENIVSRITGAASVMALDFTLETATSTTQHQPSTSGTAHSIQTQLDRYFGPEATQDMLRRGCMLVKVWRPMRRDPKHALALIDCSASHSSTIEEDLVLSTNQSLKTAARAQQRYLLKHGDGWDGPDRHVWSYMSDQQPHETVVYTVADFTQSKTRPSWLKQSGTPVVRVPIPDAIHREDDGEPEAVEVTVLACF